MKPAPFEYVVPRSVDEAVDELRRSDGEGKVLAGGQSLIPLLNMRLASPARLVDLNRIPELAYVVERDGGVAIGAMTRARTVERDSVVVRELPLVREAVACVGHPQIRTRGTLVGSIAHGDPSAEMPAVALCLDARLTVRGPHGTREIGPDELYLGYLATSLEPDEIVTEAWFPSVPPNTGQAWLELARRHGDYAIVGTGVSLTVDGDTVREVRIALTGVGGAPVRAAEAQAVLSGSPLDDARLAEAVQSVRETVDPDSDIHATAAYRRHLAGVLVERALRLAHQRALSSAPAALDIRRSLEMLGRNA